VCAGSGLSAAFAPAFGALSAVFNCGLQAYGFPHSDRRHTRVLSALLIVFASPPQGLVPMAFNDGGLKRSGAPVASTSGGRRKIRGNSRFFVSLLHSKSAVRLQKSQSALDLDCRVLLIAG